MRVISGRFKGVALTTPKAGTRPTTDRTKEAIFSHLDSWGVLDDARVLDLFAGTGALGIEALSRGARELVAVESSAPAAALIAQTLTALKHNRSWEHGMSARVVKARAENTRLQLRPLNRSTWCSSTRRTPSKRMIATSCSPILPAVN